MIVIVFIIIIVVIVIDIIVVVVGIMLNVIFISLRKLSGIPGGFRGPKTTNALPSPQHSKNSRGRSRMTRRRRWRIEDLVSGTDVFHFRWFLGVEGSSRVRGWIRLDTLLETHA